MVRAVFSVLVVFFVCLAADQASKQWMLHVLSAPPQTVEVSPFLNLRLGFNSGVSFGLFQDVIGGWPEAVAVGMALISVSLLIWAVISRDGREQIGLAMMGGGAFGNAVDRWRQGAVTDFIDLHLRGWHWPTFNLADVAIVSGCALMLLAGFTRPQQPTRTPQSS